MPHIIFGYRMVNGCYQVDPENAGRIRRLYESYLSGMSVKAAGEAAGIHKCESSLTHLMQNEAYLGNDIFPPIIDQQTFLAVAAQRESRRKKHATGMKKAVPCMSVHMAFKAMPCKAMREMSAEEYAHYLYARIQPDSEE